MVASIETVVLRVPATRGVTSETSAGCAGAQAVENLCKLKNLERRAAARQAILEVQALVYPL